MDELLFLIELHKKLVWVEKTSRYVIAKKSTPMRVGFELSRREAIDREFIINVELMLKEERLECDRMLRIISNKSTEGTPTRVSW